MAELLSTPVQLKTQESLKPLFDKNQIQIDKNKRVIFIKDLPTKADKSGCKRRYCIVQCPFCFKEFEMLKQAIFKTKSCGCVTNLFKARIKHGFTSRTNTPRLYQTWADMKTRCNCKTNKRYHRYGGRGISVCEEWNSFEGFKLWAESNGYKNNLTIDRIDNNKSYCQENCRWVTIKENIKNRPSYLRNKERGYIL